ncbi:TonB-dependent receptor [Thauera sinica]|uniref:TonB-dependent receptor n=1 Tax=Thauera sinica TaxID=2665146 RepID=A0ABW1AMP5_9RHOO|nr:TonB-dependent receptor [Thauera sp. K11]
MKFKEKALAGELKRVFSALALCSAAAHAVAQDAAPGAAAAAGAGSDYEEVGLSVVKVTAQKREELLQDVPIPINVVGGDAIRDKQISASTDVERLAPGLSAQGATSRTGKPRWFLRGIGTNDPNSNHEGPLAIYVDEVVVGYQSLQSFPLFDLDRVEVLQGPQGTLWGKNNTGGAIHFISKQPGFRTDGYAKLGVGSYGSRIAEAAFGGAIREDVLAGRASVYVEKRDGWAKNILLDEKGPRLDDVNGRFQVLARFNDNVDALFSWTTRNVETNNVPSYAVGGLPNPGSDVTLTAPGGALTQGGGSYVPPYGDDPGPKSDFFGGEDYNRSKRDSLSARINWQLGDYTLTSITALNLSDDKSLSLVGVPLDTTLNRTSSRGDGSSRQFTQELRLTSPKDRDLSWLVGAYYYRLQIDTGSRSARFQSGTTREQYSESSLDQFSTSAALFGNVNYKFTDKVSLGVGARYTRETKEITLTSLTATDTAGNANIVNFVNQNGWFLPGGVTGSGVAGVAPLSLSAKQENHRFTWDVTPQYRFSDNVLGYARIATGFRSGGFNQSISNGQIIETSPERLIDYELGLKTSWLDGRLVANGALYHYDIKDLQLNIQRAYLNTSTNTYTTSAAGSSDGTVTGFELSVDAQATRDWHVAASLGLLRSEYKNFTYNIGSGGPFDASGNEFYRTPRTSFRLDTDYTFRFASGRLILGTDWTYRSKIYFNATVQDDPVQELPGYWKGNVRATWQAPNRAWQLTAFVNNVTDVDHAFLRQIYNPNTRSYPASFDAPRTWGLQATVKF